MIFFPREVPVTLCLLRAATAPKIHPITETLPVLPATAEQRQFPANQKARERRGQELRAGK